MQPAQWAYGREGMPVSPGVQRVPPPPRGPLSPQQEWFKDLKFGMFVHWGLESLVSTHRDMAPPGQPWANWRLDARWLASELDRLGEAFDPEALVHLAETAGQRYICFTTKHHLGFANYASRHSDYTTASLGPRRDFLRALADECHRRNMPLFAYLSLSDMHHQHFRPLEPEAWQRYENYLFAQLEELAAGYAPLAGFWLDPGPWNGPSYRYPVARIERTVHERWPKMLVSGRDWDGAEQDYNCRVFLGDTGLVLAYDVFSQGARPQPGDWPFEVCDTLNQSWFYNPADANYKDAAALIRRLVEVVGRGGNYLLNHGPLPSGALNPEDAQRLEAMGEWLRRNGQAIYGTRPLGLSPQPWGWPVVKGETVYLHILRWPGKRLTLPDFRRHMSAAHWLNGPEIPARQAGERLTLELPPSPPCPVDSIAVLRLA